MIKITDTDYSLPEIHALLGDKVFSTGRTKPLLISGVDVAAGERNQYVVKFVGSPEMTTKSACFELLGAWIGMQLELNTPLPVTVNITSDFVDTLKGRDTYSIASKCVGINYGSKFMEGYAQIPVATTITGQLLDQAKNIFAFDMSISNPDRRVDKPNVISDGNNFLIYDHELCFSFLLILPFLRNKTPWVFDQSDKLMCENHYFFDKLRKIDCNFREFTERFSSLDNYFWSRVQKFIPPKWMCKEVLDIQKHLDEIKENRVVFADQLKLILQA